MRAPAEAKQELDQLSSREPLVCSLRATRQLARERAIALDLLSPAARLSHATEEPSPRRGLRRNPPGTLAPRRTISRIPRYAARCDRGSCRSSPPGGCRRGRGAWLRADAAAAGANGRGDRPARWDDLSGSAPPRALRLAE